MLSNEFWSKLEEILRQQTIHHKPELRMTIGGMLYRMRVGCPWWDFPGAFGIWISTYKRFNSWLAVGKWPLIFKALIEEPNFEWTLIDGAYAKAHQDSSGVRGSA